MTGLTEEMINDSKVMQAVGEHMTLNPEQRQKSMAKFISSMNGRRRTHDAEPGTEA